MIDKLEYGRNSCMRGNVASDFLKGGMSGSQPSSSPSQKSRASVTAAAHRHSTCGFFWKLLRHSSTRKQRSGRRAANLVLLITKTPLRLSTRPFVGNPPAAQRPLSRYGPPRWPQRNIKMGHLHSAQEKSHTFLNLFGLQSCTWRSLISHQQESFVCRFPPTNA